MRSERRFGPFRGVVTARGAFAPEGSAAEAVNARARGGGLTPRNGFQQITLRPQTGTETYGLVHLSGYGDDYEAREELLLFRSDRDVATGAFGPVRPYVVALPLADAPAPVPLTDGETPVSLPERAIQGFTFGGYGYLVQPSSGAGGVGDVTVYRHEIGRADSFRAITNTGYTPPADDPTFGATMRDLVELPYAADPDQVFFSASDADVDNEIATPSRIELRIKRNRIGGNDATASVRVIYPEPHPVPEGARYLNLAMDGAIARSIRKGGAKLTLNPDTGEIPVTEFRITGESSNRWALTARMPAGMPATITGFKLAFKAGVDGGMTGTYATLHALQLGGETMAATTAAQRPWGDDVPETGITYGARRRNTTTGAVEAIRETTAGADAIKGPLARNAAYRIGQRVTLAFESDPTTGPFEVQFLRQTKAVGSAKAVWKLLGAMAVDPEGDAATFTDGWREDELGALETIDATATPVVEPPPPFTSLGIRSGVPYKGWVVWLFAGGRKNVQHSRFGDPLELYVEGRGYDPEETTRPAVQSLADGFDDEPVAGFQAGQTLVILGKRGAYTSYGDYPAQMVPPRRVPETSGVVGPRACCRWKGSAGGYGVAWLDAHGNVWSLLSSPRFEGDASARPDELSLALRGNLRGFLAGGIATEAPDDGPWGGGGSGSDDPGTGDPDPDPEDPGTDDPDDPDDPDPDPDPDPDDPHPYDPEEPGTRDPVQPNPGHPNPANPGDLNSSPVSHGGSNGLALSPTRGVPIEDDLAGALMGYDEAEDSLFVINGSRAAVFRPRDAVDGAEHAELYVYNASEDEYTVRWNTGWRSASNAATQSGEGVGWTEGPPDRLPSLLPGTTSKLLRRDGFLKDAVPLEATVYQVFARVIEKSTGVVSRTASVSAKDRGPSSTVALPNGTNRLLFALGPQANADIIAADGLSAEIQVTNVDNPAWSDPDNWTLLFYSKFSVDGLPPPPEAPTDDLPIVWYVKAIYKRADPPAQVRVDIDSELLLYTLGKTSSFDGYGDNGVGLTGGRHITESTRLSLRSVGRKTITLSGGQGVATITMIANASNKSIEYPYYAFKASRIHGVTLALDSASYSGTVQMYANLGRIVAERPGSFTALAFAGPRLFALRSDAAVVALERDARTGAALRYDPSHPDRGIDADRPMPPGFWQFGDMAGARTRLAGVRQVLDGGAATAFSLIGDGRTISVTPGTRRWTAFPSHAAGNRLAFRIDFDQTLGRLDSLTLELTRLAERKLA